MLKLRRVHFIRNSKKKSQYGQKVLALVIVLLRVQYMYMGHGHGLGLGLDIVVEVSYFYRLCQIGTTVRLNSDRDAAMTNEWRLRLALHSHCSVMDKLGEFLGNPTRPAFRALSMLYRTRAALLDDLS